MSDLTPNLALPFILGAQAQKHVTHNEALERLDLLVQLTLVSITRASPPDAAQEGQSWAVPGGATGLWAGQDGQIASWRGGGWLFVAPREGWIAWVQQAGGIHIHTGGQWAPQAAPEGLQNLAFLGVNAAADQTNRFALRGPAALFDHDGAGHQIKLNKADAAQTGTVLFQSAYAGRAEIGLAGEDDFSIKTSADGAGWHSALRITAATGQVTLAAALRLAPGAAPANANAGDLYFDSATAKLRCHDGTIWHDLF